MKRVLIITYYWPPSGGAGVQRWLKFVKFLPGFGWEPIIIAPDPEQATYPAIDQSLINETGNNIRVIHTDDDSIFKLYKKIFGKKSVPSAGFANDSGKISFIEKISRFIRGNFFIPDPRKGWNKYALIAAREIIHTNKIDMVITTGPPHSTHLTGLKLSLDFKIPWIVDFRDPWTDIYYYQDFYPTLPAHLLNKKLEKKVILNADQIITVSQGFKKIFAGKHSCCAQKITVIPNGFDEDDFLDVPEPDRERFTITYVGTLSDAYPIDLFIQTFNELLKSGAELGIRFIGSVSENQRIKLNSIPKNHIEYISYVDHNKAIAYMGLSSALLLILPEHASAQGILPGKIFEYLASRRPILGIGPADGDAAIILKETNSGVMIDFDNKKGLSDALESLHNKYATDDKTMIVSSNIEHYSRRMLTGELARILNHQSREL